MAHQVFIKSDAAGITQLIVDGKDLTDVAQDVDFSSGNRGELNKVIFRLRGVNLMIAADDAEKYKEAEDNLEIKEPAEDG